MSSVAVVSIPKSVQKTIQNIKEIAGNHSDDEVYAMLKECSMDPNETVQKLLLQDTFHEVKRKRDRRKENVINRETVEPRWRQGTQGRGNRGIRGNYVSRFLSSEVGNGKNSIAERSGAVNHATSAGHAPVLQITSNKASTAASSWNPHISNGPTNITKSSLPQGCVVQIQFPPDNLIDDALNSRSQLSSPDDVKNSVVPGDLRQPISDMNEIASSVPLLSVSGVYSSVSDPLLVPSFDSRVPAVVGAIKREGQSHGIPSEQIKAESSDISNFNLSSSPLNENLSLTAGNTFLHVKMPNKALADGFHDVFTSRSSTSSIHPPSYGGQLQQIVGVQKVGPSKEWKPKSVCQNVVQPSETVDKSEVPPSSTEENSRSVPVSCATTLDEATLKLQKKLEHFQFSDGHVIIPDHLHVSESERTGLRFGSFGCGFMVNTNLADGHEADTNSTSLSESSQALDEPVEELCSNQSDTTTDDGEYLDHQQSPTHVEEVPHSELDVTSEIAPEAEFVQPKQEMSLPSGCAPNSVVHTTPSYSSFGLVPPMLGSQFAPLENSEPQARDPARLPSFIVPQPFDPSSYYTQFYRPATDGDGRFSPFHAAPSAAASAKYSGNIAVLPAQNAQSPQPETGSTLVLSAAAQTPLISQPAGIMQSSVAVTQQPMPVFRQPPSVHISHFPPNYIPYSQYFSPFYVPPPAIHHFLSSTAYPQQPPTGAVYPPGVGAAAALKYSLSQYKPGSNTGNLAHVSIPAGYGPFNSPPSVYSASTTVTSVNATVSDELAAAQYKEHSGYLTGQQSEASTIWVPAPGRDISSVQSSSFYSLPPSGQHVTFAPTQATHGAFAGIYHPSQTVAAATVHPLLQQSQAMAGAVEMVGPPPGIYQHPQRAQVNWGNNY